MTAFSELTLFELILFELILLMLCLLNRHYRSVMGLYLGTSMRITNQAIK